MKYDTGGKEHLNSLTGILLIDPAILLCPEPQPPLLLEQWEQDRPPLKAESRLLFWTVNRFTLDQSAVTNTIRPKSEEKYFQVAQS